MKRQNICTLPVTQVQKYSTKIHAGSADGGYHISYLINLNLIKQIQFQIDV